MAPKKNDKKEETKKKRKGMEYRDIVRESVSEQMDVLDKELDYRPISLERGSFVAGTLSFGSLVLDLITGGGAPPGKWTDVFGPESSGKSTIIYNMIVSAQKAGIPVLFYDHEAGSDPIYMRNLGVDFQNTDGFYYFQPDNGSDTYRHINRIIRDLPEFEQKEGESRPLPSMLILLDSLDAMVSGDLVDNPDNNQRGRQAAMHGEGMRMIKGALGKKNVSVVSTNQLKMAPGVMFGNPEYEPGGQAVKFYPDLKIRVNAVGKVSTARGGALRYVNIRTIKNKQFCPFRVVSDKENTAPALSFGKGFDRGADTIAYMILTDQLKKRGHKYSLDLVNCPEHLGVLCESAFAKDDLIMLLTAQEVQDFCRGQIESDIAFKLYFAHEQIEDPMTMSSKPPSLADLQAKLSKDKEETKKAKEKAKNASGNRCGDCKKFDECVSEFDLEATDTPEELDCNKFEPKVVVEMAPTPLMQIGKAPKDEADSKTRA